MTRTSGAKQVVEGRVDFRDLDVLKSFTRSKTRFGERKSYVLIYGDEVTTLSGPALSGSDWKRARYRSRSGKIKKPKWRLKRALEQVVENGVFQ